MIKPNGHKVIVKADEVQKMSKGGIIMAVDERLEKAGIQRGILVDYGDQAWKAFSNDFTGEPWAKKGDYVIFSKFAGKFIQDPVDDAIYVVLNDEDVIATIREGSNEIPDCSTKQVVDNREEDQ